MNTSSQAPKKPRLLSNFDGRDHISSLPDSIMTHILSRLPTKQAAQTSILSKDWQFKWLSICNVNISDAPSNLQVSEYLWKYYKVDDIYTSRRLHSGKAGVLLDAIKKIPLSHNVRSFTVCWWGICYHLYLNDWISEAINLDVETFRLLYPWTCVVIPGNLFKCASLKNLELKLPSILRFPATAESYASLVDLSLHSVEILNEGSSPDTLMFRFQVLTTFKLYQCNFLNVKFVEVHAPKLVIFKWSCCRGVDAHLIKILEARPVCFEIHDRHIIKTGPTPRRSVSEQRQRNLEVRNLFEGISSVKHLVLHSATITDRITKQPNPLPSFHSLERLGICFDGNFNGLLELLEATPKLRFFDLDRRTSSGGKLKVVPSCVTASLEEIKLNWHSHHFHKFQLEKFLLKNAAQLKKIMLAFDSKYDLLRGNEFFVRELSKLPKVASGSLKIVVVPSF